MEAIDHFLSVIPLPAYSPATGQLKLEIESAVQRLEEQCGVSLCSCSSSSSKIDLSICAKMAYAMVHLDRVNDAILLFESMQERAASQENVRVQVLALIERGILLRSGMKEVESAKADLEAGLRLAQDHLGDDLNEFFQLNIVERGKFELGWLLFDKGEFGSAVEYLKAGLAPHIIYHAAVVHSFLGDAYRRLGELDLALEHANACVSLGGGRQFNGYTLLGFVYMDRKEYKQAVGSLREMALAAGEAEIFGVESFGWWAAGCFALEHCSDCDQAVDCLVWSLKAALRIQGDLQLQARRLASANAWLLNCLLVQQHGRVISEFFGECDEDGGAQMVLPRSMQVLTGEAYGLLGVVMLSRGSLDDAYEYLDRGISLLPGDETKLLFRFQHAMGMLLSRRSEHDKALQRFEQCTLLAPTERDKVSSYISCCLEVKSCLDMVRAFEMFGRIQAEHAALLETDWDLRVDVMLGVGQCLFALGNNVQAQATLETAKETLEARERFADTRLGAVYSMLFLCYVQSNRFSAAFELASRFQSKCGEDAYLMLYHGVANRLLGDNEASVKTLTDLLEASKDWMLRYSTLSSLAYAYRKMGDLDSALDKFDQALEEIPDDISIHAAQVYINRAGVFNDRGAEQQRKGNPVPAMASFEKALAEYDRAVQIMRRFGEWNLQDLVRAYAGEAVVHFHMKNYSVAMLKLDSATSLVSSDDALLMGKIKRIRASILATEGRMEESASEAREAALLFADVQMKLQNMESAWVTLLDDDMKHIYYFMQRISSEANSFVDALLWAERSRMRLYFHLADQALRNSTPASPKLLDPLAFDKDDHHAASCIKEAVAKAGYNSVVVEYAFSANHPLSSLLIYVVHSTAGEDFTVRFKRVRLQEFFASKENKVMGGNLDALIRKARTVIQRESHEAEAKVALGILYKLTVLPVWEHIEPHDTVIFAPQGTMSLVPFAALYDGSEGQFLVEKKNVGVIPSIRALRRCQLHQDHHHDHIDEPSFFVAGDPEPMGLDQPQLPGARKEAEEIAKQLGVDALVGAAMTKSSVMQALSSASVRVAVLATHGLVSPAYPHGALVMQGQNQQQGFNELTVGVTSSLRREVDLALKQQAVLHDQVLTAKEIERLEKGIAARLVVLSACQTGDGVVTSEGLLGLGRAVLQAGAACVLVTLWKVDDAATLQLMTGVFEELNKQHTIVEAVRFSMLKLIDSGKPIRFWAPLVALGSPTLRISLAEEA
ncbi:hypothetical protein SELMODRAFT_428691 [Selaginella moellendorffii]|uniref:CHAT domain-containing protein n=1 Tax=Selaginella moellendorffii TaxID=88036 RepID=D8T3Q7_SELML|nr:uncharacterized protein LOC9647658 [Selaginella moellendorffii]EFJ08780.1 hypothetical protein SELMODRAFT_428691 [Selaginella moellendorffii]|eukprot:XP_002990220.1 uncharacterized protein LOC9647658 [Selaginella moellendorffii]